VRLTGKPVLSTWRGGKLTLSIENFSHADVDVDISVEHHGSNWSQGWQFELEAESGPVKFSEEFEPPEEGRRGTYTLTVNAAGMTLAQAELSGRTLTFPRKTAVTAAVVAAGAALGTALAVTGPFTNPPAKTVQDTSATPTISPAGAATTSPVTVGPGPVVNQGSGGPHPVTGSTAATNTGVANTGTASSTGTATAQQGQVITFTSTPPASAAPGDTYQVTATGGASGEQVKFTPDASSGPVCSINGDIVTFSQVGHCLIDANQAGSDQFRAASQAQQSVTVAKLSQTITFKPPATVNPGSSGVLIATSSSGDAVQLEIDMADSTNQCRLSGTSSPDKIAYGKQGEEGGDCVIDAVQPGDSRYAAAPEVVRDVRVLGIGPQEASRHGTMGR
jgi:hypothetical protein